MENRGGTSSEVTPMMRSAQMNIYLPTGSLRPLRFYVTQRLAISLSLKYLKSCIPSNYYTEIHPWVFEQIFSPSLRFLRENGRILGVFQTSK